MAIKFTTRILQFAEQGEKTGWTYIEIPADIVQQLKPGNKKTFRVKGKLDDFPIRQIAIMPRGDGSFIMPVNATLRKGIGKRKGAMLQVLLEEDKEAERRELESKLQKYYDKNEILVKEDCRFDQYQDHSLKYLEDDYNFSLNHQISELKMHLDPSKKKDSFLFG